MAGFIGEPGSGIGPTKARIKLAGFDHCQGDTYYDKLTIKYGKGFDKTYIRNLAIGGCGFRAASRANFTNCGTTMPGPFINTKARGVGCDLAKKVSKAYVINSNPAPHGFTCSDPEDAGIETQKARCGRGAGDQVKFTWGV